MGMLDVREPFEDLLTQGMVRKDGTAMSSSSGNVVSPRPFVEEFGADTGRLFMMNAAQPEKDFDWTEEGAKSARRFLANVHGLARAFAEGEVTTGERGAAGDYVAREAEAVVANATEEFETFRFNHALQGARELVSLLRRYREHTDPDPGVFERAIEVTAKILAPVAPHVAEEVWDFIDRDGLIAEADWPAAETPDSYDVERRLIENTREDIRDIVDVAGIEDPERITVVTAPTWKYEALELVLDLDAGADVVGTVMRDEDLRRRGEAAADFAKDLAAEAQSLSEQLPPEREREALRRAAWLMTREFDADITVAAAKDVDESMRKQAEPGRPAIEIRE
jgi:leucyl-tRNA synthetase